MSLDGLLLKYMWLKNDMSDIYHDQKKVIKIQVQMLLYSFAKHFYDSAKSCFKLLGNVTVKIVDQLCDTFGITKPCTTEA